MYISRQRTVATSIDVWNALRAPSAVPAGASTGRRSRRRITRSADERWGTAMARSGGAAVSDMVSLR